MIKTLKIIAIILGILGSLVGIILGILKIWDLIKSPSSVRLQAEVVQVKAPLPQNLAEELKDLSNFPIGWMRKQDIPELKQVSDQILQKVIPIFEKIAKDQVDQILALSSSRPNYLTIIKVINPLDETLSAVQIKIPYPVELFAQIVKDDMQHEIQKFKGTINVGILSPRAEVNIYIYTNSLFFSDEILLTHEKGIGSVTFHHPISDFPRWKETWREKFSTINVFVSVLPLLAVCGFLAIILILSEKYRITFTKR